MDFDDGEALVSEAMSGFVRHLIASKTSADRSNEAIWEEMADTFKDEFPGFKLCYIVWNNVTTSFCSSTTLSPWTMARIV